MRVKSLVLFLISAAFLLLGLRWSVPSEGGAIASLVEPGTTLLFVLVGLCAVALWTFSFSRRLADVTSNQAPGTATDYLLQNPYIYLFSAHKYKQGDGSMSEEGVSRRSKRSRVVALEGLKRYQKDMSWIFSHYEELREKHRDEYVAVKNEITIDHDPNLQVLMDRLTKRHHQDPAFCAIEYMGRDPEYTVL